MRRFCTFVAVVALAACGGREQDDQLAGASAAGPQASGAADRFAVKIDLTSYEHGKPGGALVKQLEKLFHPKKWRGETDGPVLMDAESLPALSDSERIALRTVLKEGHAILVTGVTEDLLVRLHAINGSVPAITLTNPAELYVLAAPQGRLRMLAIRSIPLFDPSPDADVRKEAYAEMVLDWFRTHVRQTFESGSASMASALMARPKASAAAEASDYNTLGSDVNQFPWSHTDVFSMEAFYSNHCGAKQKCTDTFAVTTYSWAVHSPISVVDQPGDYLLTRVSAVVNTAGCKLSIGKNNRFAGYWLRQANVGASVPDAALVPGVKVLAGYTAPQAQIPDVQYSTGVTWNFGGSGTIGSSAGFSGGKPSAEVSRSLGFSAGVTYSNTKTYQAKAITILPQIAADPSNATKVLWTYDSWNHVKQNIDPGNHACGGPGLLVTAGLPAVIYGSSFEPSQEWVWALLPEVRSALPINRDGVPILPVKVDLSMLLGWSYFWDITQCNYSGSLGTFWVGDKSIDVVGDVANNPSNGLMFDSGCGTAMHFGTIPLGDPRKEPRASNDNGTSNVGTPYPFTFSLSLPLAPDPRPMELSSIEPNHGPAGTTVTLRGISLQTAHSVSFGGLTPVTKSMEWPEGTDPATGKRYQAYITVTAPPLIPNVPGTKAAISVSNAVKTSGGTAEFVFTYE